MGITYGDYLIDSGYYDITPEQEREIEADARAFAAALVPEGIEGLVGALEDAAFRYGENGTGLLEMQDARAALLQAIAALTQSEPKDEAR